MKNRSLRGFCIAALLIFSAGSVLATGNPTIAKLPDNPDYLHVFDINSLPEITIEVAPDQWNVLLSSTQYVRPKAQVTSFTFSKNGVVDTVNNIGVKVSGNTSFVNPEVGKTHCVNCADWVQANFNFDFKAFVSTQTFRGLTGLKLKRFRDDASYVREVVANDIMQRFGIFTVHASTYAKVYVHVTGDTKTAYFGVYRMNEDVNELEYLSNRFGVDNDAGELWKASLSTVPNCSGPADLLPITVDSTKMSRDDCTYEFKGKKAAFPLAKTNFVAFLDAINTKSGADFKAYADAKINTDLLLKGMAAEAVLGQWDGMSANFSNYYLYFDEAGVLQFIPFDMDNTFGTSTAVVGDSGRMDLLTWGKNILVKKMLSIPEYKTKYVGYLNELVTNTDLMTQTRTVSWIKARHDLIKNFLVNATGDNGSYADRPASWGNQPTYRFFDFTTGTNWYTTKTAAVAAAVAGNSGFQRNFSQLFFRGTANAWNTTPMQLIANNTWQIQATFGPDINQRFKVDVKGDWTLNYGDTNVDKILDQGGADIKVSSNKTYIITVNDATRTYTVVEANLHNVPPVANAGPDKTVLVNSPVRFDGSASTDSDGSINTYMWSNSLTAPAGDFVYQQAGVYTETLTVTDDDGAVASDTVVITVVDNFPPVANAGPDQTVEPGQVVTLDGSASSDSNGSIASYGWSNGLSGPTASTSFDTEGIYTLTLTVTDNQGAPATDTVVITVKAKPKTVNINFTCNNGTTVVGQNVYVVGNQTQLGSWTAANAIKLNPTAYPSWTGTIALPLSTAVEWKCIKMQGTSVVWQGGANNALTTPATGTANAVGSF